MTDQGRRLGVAISGGGHRASLWGLGTLLYLVDSGMNADVTVVSSVSGGSITNGVVGHRVGFRSTHPAEFRREVQPLVTHITTDGLFFYGSATNRYLCSALALAAAAAAAWLLVVGIMVTQVMRAVLDLIGLCACGPAQQAPLWWPGIGVAAVFASLAVFARRYAKAWNRCVTLVGVLGVGLGLAPAVAAAAGTEWRLGLERWFPVMVAIALALTVLALYWFERRSRVAEKALDSVHFRGATLAELGMAGDLAATHHVVCATEMQSGLHAYFSSRFIYGYAFGASTRTADLPLARAVQASAALPGAFAARRIDTASLAFFDPATGGAPPAAPSMVLLDGGVYDNMAEQWFVGMTGRKARWTAPLAGGSTVGDLISEVDEVIVSNASAGWEWRPLGGWAARASRMVTEASLLGRTQEVMYNTIGKRRRAHLFDLWDAGDGAGTFVEVDQNPRARVPGSDTFADLRRRLDALGLSDAQWKAVVATSEGYPTVLRRISPEDARIILWHAYVNTAVALAVFLGRPIPDELSLPTVESFAAIDPVQGLVLQAP